MFDTGGAFKNASARLGERWNQNCRVERQFALAQYFSFYFFQFLVGIYGHEQTLSIYYNIYI